MSYSAPTSTTYRFPAVSVVNAATLGRIMGPANMLGRLVDISYVVTTGVTVAASNIRVGTAAATSAYGTLAVPIAAADLVGNGMVRGATNDLPMNAVILVGSAGGATAGAVDILVVIDWF